MKKIVLTILCEFELATAGRFLEAMRGEKTSVDVISSGIRLTSRTQSWASSPEWVRAA